QRSDYESLILGAEAERRKTVRIGSYQWIDWKRIACTRWTDQPRSRYCIARCGSCYWSSSHFNSWFALTRDDGGIGSRFDNLRGDCARVFFSRAERSRPGFAQIVMNTHSVAACGDLSAPARSPSTAPTLRIQTPALLFGTGCGL